MTLYQIRTKFRDEPRTRSGVLRSREFQTTDAYSFDATDEGLAESYRLHREAHARIFTRLGFDHRIVSAVPGVMGGVAAEEFLAPADAGEETFAHCPACDYAAVTGAVTFTAKPLEDPGARPAGRAGHPRHPDHRDAGRAPGRTGLRDPEEPAGQGRRRDHRGRRARRPRGGPRQARRAPGARRRGAGHRRGLRGPPRPGPRLRRPAGPGVPLHRRPADRPRHRLGHRRQQARHGTPATWCAGRDFEVDRPPRRGRGRAGRPLPRAAAPACRLGRADRDRPHLPARPQVRRRLRARRARPERQAGPRHHGLLRHRRLPRGRRPRRADRRRPGPVLARARVAPADVHVVAAGKAVADRDSPWRSPRSCTPPGSGSWSTTGPGSRRA